MVGPCVCCNLCWNTSLAGKDELVGAVLIESNGSFTSIPLVSLASIPAPAITPIVTLPLDNKLFKQFMKVYLEA